MNLKGPSRAGGLLLPQPLCLRSALAVLLVLTQTSPAAAADALGRVPFQITAGPAQQGLLEFGYQSGLNVNFSALEVSGSHTRNVNGFLQPRTALLQLLRGSSLCSEFTNSGKSVSVVRCADTSEHSKRSPPVVAGTSPADSTEAPPSSGLAAVLVTGWNVHDVQPEPNMVSISGAELRRYGIRTAAELVARFAELGATPLGARADGNSGLGALANLRGQGAGATLVLLNGNRLANSGIFGSFVDLSNIPVSIIDRVEVVLDGASPQYGSDAAGGVINIITLSKNQALQFDFQLDEGWGGFHNGIISQTAGHEWDSGVVVESLEYLRASPWAGRNLAFPQTQPLVDRVPQKELASGYAHLEQNLSPLRTQVTAEGIYTHRRSGDQYDLTLPTAAVDQQTDVSVQMTYGSIQSQTTIATDGVLLLSLTRATETERQTNWPVGLVKLKDGTSVAPLTLGIAPTWFRLFSRTDQLLAKFDESIVSYPAGTMKALIGGERRWQALNTFESEHVPGAANRYKRQASAGFGEVHIPIAGGKWSVPGLRSLELALAGRYEGYTDFGGRFTPQVWLHWVPYPTIEITASWGRSSQAPTLASLDPSRNTIILAPIANTQSKTGYSTALVETGNRSTLSAETASSVNLGIRFEWPLSSRSLLTTAVNVFRVHFYDRIAAVDISQFQVADPNYQPFINRDLSAGDRQGLCAPSSPFFGDRSNCLTVPIVGLVDLTLHNMAALSTEGLILHSNWRDDFGTIRTEVDLHDAYYFQFAQRMTPSTPTVSFLRTQTSPAALQITSRLSLKVGPVELGALIQSISGFRDQSTLPSHYVPTWTTLGLQLQYNVLDDMVISLMAQNIFDTELPLLNDAAVNQSYDLLSGFAVRRLVSIGVLKRF